MRKRTAAEKGFSKGTKQTTAAAFAMENESGGSKRSGGRLYPAKSAAHPRGEKRPHRLRLRSIYFRSQKAFATAVVSGPANSHPRAVLEAVQMLKGR